MRAAVVVDALRPGGTWTDPHGVVHVRDAGTDRAFCRAKVVPYTNVTAVIGCDACVNESIREYARHHVCGPECHV